MSESRASHTAVLVCQGRAAADGRLAPGRFADPTAEALLRADERELVGQVRDESPPRGWGPRFEYEMVRGSSEVIVPRTVAIDDAVRTGPRSQVVILGAGLDGRAWRMPELAESEVFEVDQPASQRDKQDRAAGLSGAKPRYVPVDFGRDDLADALEAAGHRSHTPTTWIWEGVVPYLTRAEVATTLSAVSARSAAGSRMIVNYQAASGAMTVALVVMRVFSMTVRRASPWRNEPWRSTWTPDDMAALLRENGFAVQRDDNLVSLATTLCMPIHRRGSLENSRVAVADHE